MRILIFTLLALPLLFVSAGYGLAVYHGFGHLAAQMRAFSYVGIGAAIYIAVVILFRIIGRSVDFAQTFCHELNHTVFNILFLNRIRSFSASADSGGEVEYTGRGNPLICLAPYSVPLFALIALLIKLFAKESAFPVIDGCIGFFLLFHLHSVLMEARLRQTDLKVYGYVFSYAMILFLNIALVFWILISAGLGFHAGWEFLKNGFFEILNLVKFIKGTL